MSDVALSEYRALLRNDPCGFIHRSFLELNPQTRFEMNWHIEILAAKLEAVRRGEITRLIINLPPRHLKSHVVTIAAVAWFLGHNPSKQILCASYSQDLSNKFARECRKLIESPFYRSLFDTRLSQVRHAVEEFETTQGGYRLSTSVAGGLTGRGADIIIVDDPLKADEALSEVCRTAVNDWFDNTLYTRLNNKETSAIILIMQRLHGDDLTGHVLEQEGWEVVSFPAIAEQDETYEFSTPFGHRRITRRAGEILHPARESEITLKQIRATIGEYNFAAQYQQSPEPASGIFLKTNWLKYYTPEERPDRFDLVYQSWDTANKVTELSDFSVCVTLGLKDDRVFVLDVFRRKLEFPDLKRMVRELAGLHHASTVLIEDKASGTQLIQELRYEGLSSVSAVHPEGDKLMRFMAQTPKFEGGFVYLPTAVPWLHDFVREITSFPNAKFDDQADAIAQALKWLTDRKNSPGWAYLEWGRREMKKLASATKTRVRMRATTCLSSHLVLLSGSMIAIPESRIIEVDEEDGIPLFGMGFERCD
jgi:predicted phage terminase large subunit-like protein